MTRPSSRGVASRACANAIGSRRGSGGSSSTAAATGSGRAGAGRSSSAIPALGTTDAGLPLRAGRRRRHRTLADTRRAGAGLRPARARAGGRRRAALLRRPDRAPDRSPPRHRRGHREIPTAPRAPPTADDGRAPRGDPSDDRRSIRASSCAASWPLVSRRPSARCCGRGCSPSPRSRPQARSGGGSGGARRGVAGRRSGSPRWRAVAVVLLAVAPPNGRADRARSGTGGSARRPFPGVATCPVRRPRPRACSRPETVAEAERTTRRGLSQRRGSRRPSSGAGRDRRHAAGLDVPDGWPARFDRDGDPDRDVVAVIGIAPDGTPVCCLTLKGDLIARAQEDGILASDRPARSARRRPRRTDGRSSAMVHSLDFVRGIEEMAPDIATLENAGPHQRGSPAESFGLIAILGAAAGPCRWSASGGGPVRDGGRRSASAATRHREPRWIRCRRGRPRPRWSRASQRATIPPSPSGEPGRPGRCGRRLVGSIVSCCCQLRRDGRSGPDRRRDGPAAATRRRPVRLDAGGRRHRRRRAGS